MTGDVLRPTETRFAPSQHKNIRWLYHLLRLPLTRATELPTQLTSWGDPFPTEEFYLANEAPFSLEGWAKLYDAEAISVEALSIINHAFTGALVVGYELPPVVTRAFSLLGIDWVDVNVHPVRFLPDLLFAFSTSNPGVLSEAVRDHQADHAFWDWAALLVATAVRQPQPRLSNGTTLAIGQVFGDRSLIREGGFLDLGGFSEAVLTVAKRSSIAFKPHPYQRSDFGLLSTGLRYKDVAITNDPMYALLAHTAVAEILTVSSSVGVEAPYFEKKVNWLGKSPFRVAPDRQRVGPDSHLSLGYELLQADFWRRILRPILPTTSPDGGMLTYPPNTLRMSLKNFWGYNRLTTDHLVEAWREARPGEASLMR